MYKQQGPPQYQEDLRQWHEMINLPSVGCDSNFLFPAFQLNIAPAVAAASDHRS